MTLAPYLPTAACATGGGAKSYAAAEVAAAARATAPVPGDVGETAWEVGATIWRDVDNGIKQTWVVNAAGVPEIVCEEFPGDENPLLVFPASSDGWNEGESFVFLDQTGSPDRIRQYRWADVATVLTAVQSIYHGNDPSSLLVTASGTASMDGTNQILALTSTSTPSIGQTLTTIRYTLTFAGNAAATNGSDANDGRVITIEGPTHATLATAATVSDTGGTPLARLTAAQLAGTLETLQLTTSAANDVHGDFTVTLYAEDGSGNDTTNLTSQTNVALASVAYAHDGTGGTSGTLDATATYGNASSHVANWRPYGDATDQTQSMTPSITLSGGAGAGDVTMCLWALTQFRCDNNGLTGAVPELGAFPVTNMSFAFATNAGLTTLGNSLNLPTLVTGTSMFHDCSGLTGGVDTTPLTALTDGSYMFFSCSGLTGGVDLSGLTALTDGSSMFNGCSGLTGTVDMSPLTALVTSTSMFQLCSGLTGGVDTTPLTALTDGSYMFFSCSGLTGTVDLSGLTALVTGSSMFQLCSGLTGGVDLSPLTALVTGPNMFNDCSGLTGGVDLSPLTALTDGSSMFNDCSGLNGTVDLSGLTALVAGSSMFQLCSGLTGGVDMSPLTALVTGTNMFFQCSGLNGTVDLSGLTALTDGSNMFNGCSGLTGGVDMSPLTALNNGSNMFFSCSSITGLTPGGPLCVLWSDTFRNTAIPAADVDAWIEFLDASAQNNGSFSYSPMAANAHLDANRSGAASAALAALVAPGRDWVRSGTY